LPVEVLEGRPTTPLPALPGELGAPGFNRGPRRALVGDHAEDVAGLGNLGQPENDRGRRGPRLLHPLAVLVLERADAPEGLADDDDVADVERAGLDQDGTDRAAVLVHAGLDDRPDRGPL